jgi:type VI secretion system secreted protein VgrG
MGAFELDFECGESSLTVRRFSIHEAVSTPFTVSVWARSESPTIDLGAIIGLPAGLKVVSGYANVAGGSRVWSGVCSYMEQTHAERRGNKVQSTYHLRITPSFQLLVHRRTNRIFQHLTIPDIVDKILDEWGIKRAWKIDRGSYPKLEYRVQYAESEFAFLSRLLEEAGIAYVFPDVGNQAPILTFNDALHKGTPRGGPPVTFEPNPTQAAEREFVSQVHLVHEVRPGAYTTRDYDFRKPDYRLLGEAPRDGVESKYEQYHYIPGGSFVETTGGGDTPVADDRSVSRHDQKRFTERATRALEAARADRAAVAFETNLHDLSPGMIFAIGNHPHSELGRKLLITDIVLEGTAEGEWVVLGHAGFADVPFRPPLITPRPEVLGVQTVKVVGPKTGDPTTQEIHTDEFGRVRVQFPWDRQGKDDDGSTCWMRVHEGWGGAGYGWLNLPRVGHEVMVTFLEGDPDRPIVSGRLYNATHPVPYKLPDHKTVSTWKSDSSPGSNGFNEVKFEDMKGDELFFMQAEKNRRLLVKNDETLTVSHDRAKNVISILTETVGGNRMQVTRNERHEMTNSDHVVLIKGNKKQLIRNNEDEVNQGWRKLLGGSDQDIVIRGVKRELDEWDLHTHVLGAKRERVGRDQSMTVYQERHEKVKGTFAREAGKELHIVAGNKLVGEAPDVTMKGAGGFIRIDAVGVVISGTKVDINVSGSAGHGHGAHPREVVDAKPAQTRTGASWDAAEDKGHAGVEALREALIVKGKVGPDATRTLDLLKMALSGEVATPHDGAVFWSGGKDLAGVVADEFAAARTAAGIPSARLEATPGGSALGAAVTSGADEWAGQIPAWLNISKRFALQASGDVHMIISYMPLSETAVFREEVKVLAANKKVTSINVWLMTKDDNGEYIKGPDGKHVLEQVTMSDVLKHPPKKP